MFTINTLSPFRIYKQKDSVAGIEEYSSEGILICVVHVLGYQNLPQDVSVIVLCRARIRIARFSRNCVESDPQS